MSLGFEDIATGNTDANKVLSGFQGEYWDEAGNFKLTAPQILVLNASGAYDFYYYLIDGYVDDSTTKEGWCDPEGTYVDLPIESGLAFWVKSPSSDCTTIASGAIASEDSVDVTIPANTFTLVGNAFPIAVTLNTATMKSDDIQGVMWDEAGDFKLTAPQILVLNASGAYDFYYYLLDGYVDDTTTKEGWCDPEGTYVDAVTIGVGGGCWIKSLNEMTVTFTK